MSKKTKMSTINAVKNKVECVEFDYNNQFITLDKCISRRKHSVSLFYKHRTEPQEKR